ncbi:hypothetical protein HOLleu_13945 [Holothuria leucospilota]|uniref:Uncharacterized protein n=1 Tax=Holothuria leucospilota TaxID=206669 RepID=A0A9Q1HBY3_HOLLE|nr:hypothetical protein HOLleu_13945 [Holothuria leucospilota]
MTECGANISKVDPTVFYWFNNSLDGLLASHVDDFLWAWEDRFKQVVIDKVRKALYIGHEESQSFKYIGLHLESINGVIKLDQHNYAKTLLPIPITKERERQKDDPLSTEELGQIMWIANQTRPDILFDACLLSAVFKKAKVSDLLDTNKVVCRIQSEKVTLTFQQLGHRNALRLILYNNASLGNLPDGGSQGGHIIFLARENGKAVPIAWQPKRIRRVVRSSLSAETLAMADAIDNAIFLAALLTELLYGTLDPPLLPFVCITNNHSLFDNIYSTNLVHEKRLRIEIRGIKELIDNKQKFPLSSGIRPNCKWLTV